MALSIHDFHDDPRNAEIRIWINGALKPRAEATVSVFDSGFVLGDGVWAPYWYDAVWRSTGFEPWRAREDTLSGDALAVAETCRPVYERLRSHRIAVG